MSELDEAMLQHMKYLVSQNGHFSYTDFLNFEVNGMRHSMTHGTFRNKVSNLIKCGAVYLARHSAPAKYTLWGRIDSIVG